MKNEQIIAQNTQDAKECKAKLDKLFSAQIAHAAEFDKEYQAKLAKKKK